MTKLKKPLDPHLKKILEKTLFSVLEQHFFLLLDPCVEYQSESLPSLFYEVSMSFSGDLEGNFVLVISESACAEAYAGMSGATDIGSKEEIIDTAKEVLNYLGPNILIEWAERVGKPSFQVSIPNCCEISFEKWQQIKNNSNNVSFATNGEPVILYMDIADKHFE